MEREQIAQAHAAMVRAFEAAGGQSAYGRLIKRRQSTISDWANNPEKLLPAEYVLITETETGVLRFETRPDLYPRERFHGVDRDALRGAHA